MVQPCRLAQLCQLMPDEVDCEGDAEDCLCPKDSQELLAAVAILRLLQLESQEDYPQREQHGNL